MHAIQQRVFNNDKRIEAVVILLTTVYSLTESECSTMGN